MARSVMPAQQKLAEKLTILNDRGVGMLTRIYNIKKVINFGTDRTIFKSIEKREVFSFNIQVHMIEQGY